MVVSNVAIAHHLSSLLPVDGGVWIWTGEHEEWDNAIRF